ncbi:sulfatase-like hydrolase/transferase [Paraglaciecola aquimarina]|uniref:Sulfatase-like hydrolase/transferase n=1 Tax=Paraglaciecola aquimarina TaxID=1235557 RepID=A0ABU3SWG5_9ALTE|nr:sulfatase-like hydrolase/transferase [Paraglaciecola aquimarina]MDU0354341.1 sulfatase-like hydrolase/transferase [Paraglaciecola aquimarina]
MNKTLKVLAGYASIGLAGVFLASCGDSANDVQAQSKEVVKSPKKQYNVLYIMTDDHAAQAIGTYGGRLAKLNPTPNLDKLASEGMVFDNAFVTNSICSPSRATILTGQYSQTNGVQDLKGGVGKENQYLPIEMKKAGYETALVGKWHLKQEPGAFDYYQVLLVPR